MEFSLTVSGTNPYEPPKSPLESGVAKTEMPYLFSTSPMKLALMSICTFGIYEQYWFYKNWVLIRDRTGENIMPFWRAVFAPLWAYSFFKIIKELAAENGSHETLSVGPLALSYFVVQGLSRLSNPFWLVSMLSFMMMFPANNLALELNQRHVADFKNNDSFSGWNWLGLIVGGLFFVAIVVVTFNPEVFEE